MQGYLVALERVFMVLILVNCELKQNMFALIFLAISAYYWIIKQSSSKIKTMNSISIILMLLQYILFLLNINHQTALVYLPKYLVDHRSMSVAALFLNQEYTSYLGFVITDYSLAFILNALVIFAITTYSWQLRKILSYALKRVKQIEAQQVKFSLTYTVYLNYQRLKNHGYAASVSLARSPPPPRLF